MKKVKHIKKQTNNLLAAIYPLITNRSSIELPNSTTLSFKSKLLLKVYNYNQQTQHFQTENKPDEQSIFKTLNLGIMKNAVRYLYMKKKQLLFTL